MFTVVGTMFSSAMQITRKMSEPLSLNACTIGAAGTQPLAAAFATFGAVLLFEARIPQ